MAFPQEITLVDGGSYIEIQYDALHKVTVPKLGLKTKLKKGIVMLFWDSSFENKSGRPWIELNYENIASPTVASAAALRTLILNWIDTESPEAQTGGGGGDGSYIGKPSGGDFVTTYISGTTINLGYRPAFLTGGTAAESVAATWAAVTDGSFRATIDGTGYNFDAIDFTGNTTMALVAATVQAAVRVGTGALETVTWDTNHFIGSSVLFEATSGFSVLTSSTGVVGTDISGVVGTWMDANAGSGVATVVRGGYPPGITGFIDEDIEYVRQIATDGSVTAVYERVDSIMAIAGHTLTVAEATFISTDTFVVGTNVARGLVDDIIRLTSSSYIGKPANGDFITAYTSATTITCSVFPPEIAGINHEDIEIVKQFDAAGNVIKTFTKDDTLISEAANVITVTDATFAATDTFIVYTNIPRPTGSGGGINPDYKIGSWDGSVTYASSTTVTLAGSYPTINFDSQVVYIKYTDATLNTAEVFRNGQNGVLIEHSAGTLTLVNAGTPFAATNVYEVGLSATPVSLDIGSDATKVSVLNPDPGHYTDVELIIDEADLGIDGTFDGGGAQDLVFTDTGETFTTETVAEGYTIYNVTQATSAIITTDTLSGQAGDGGAGTPTADDITHAALGANWVNTNVASIPEVKRFVFSAESFPKGSIDVFLDSQDANNACYCKIYATNDDTADATSDIWWKNVSDSIFGNINGLSADGIGAAARVVTQGIYPLDTDTVILKYMLKIVAVNDDGTQDNIFKIRIKKGY